MVPTDRGTSGSCTALWDHSRGAAPLGEAVEGQHWETHTPCPSSLPLSLSHDLGDFLPFHARGYKEGL